MTAMEDLMNRLEEFFAEETWPARRLEGEPLLQLAFDGENGKWACYARAGADPESVGFYSICPLTVPEARRAAVMELVTRANYGLLLGNFELDLVDGEVRYKTSVGLEGAEPTAAVLRGVAYPNVLMMDRYLPAIMSVISGARSAAEAVAEIETAQVPPRSPI